MQRTHGATMLRLGAATRGQSEDADEAFGMFLIITRSIAPTFPHSPWAQVMIKNMPKASSACSDCPRVAAPRRSMVAPWVRYMSCQSKHVVVSKIICHPDPELVEG